MLFVFDKKEIFPFYYHRVNIHFMGENMQKQAFFDLLWNKSLICAKSSKLEEK